MGFLSGRVTLARYRVAGRTPGSFGSAKMPPPEAEEKRPRLEARVNQLRHLNETLDLLYITVQDFAAAKRV